MATGFTYLHYILKDHLGSWTTITDASGNVEEEHSYDAWGNFRDPYTWVGHSYDKPMFDRGFTGHEHLRFFDLINMNGRMYDPVMSTFLSVDAYVQDPTSAQGFNRYAYCSHNPLRYVDPTGWQQQNPSSNPNFNTNHNNSRSVQGDDPLEGWGSVSGYTFATSSGMCGNTLVTFYSEGNEIGCGYMLNDAIVEAKWSDSDYAKGIAYSHFGTPASQGGQYYYTVHSGNNTNVHGTGGNIGGSDAVKAGATHKVSSDIFCCAAPAALVISQFDTPAIGPADVIGVAVGAGILVVGGVAWGIEELIDYVDEYGKSNGKNEQHGDNGRAIGKSESQIGELENQLKNAKNNKEREKINRKIANIKKLHKRKRKERITAMETKGKHIKNELVAFSQAAQDKRGAQNGRVVLL